MMNCFLIASLILLISSYTFAAKESTGPVTCGSVIKLVHKETGGNLHSHAIAWGSGSGQQSVTTNKAKSEKASLWVVKEAANNDICHVGEPIKCGEVIRLEHVETGKNLHSHLFKAPLSGNQEVSGFGENGKGDTGDNWQVICETKDQTWVRGKPISLKHVDTNKYLSTAENFKFNQQNCGGACPIMDQTEVSSSPKKDANSKWMTGQGVYFPSKTDKKSSTNEDDYDDEL